MIRSYLKNIKLFRLRLKTQIELNVLHAYDDRYIKTKIWTYGDPVDSNFLCLNVPEDNTWCELFPCIWKQIL